MKQSQIIVIILLIMLMLGGWASSFVDAESGGNTEYQSHIESAEEYLSRGLYQKAIEEYEAAISIENAEKDWTSMLNAYAYRYKESNKIYNDYVEAVRRAVSAYNKNADYTITLVNLYVDKEEYSSAYKYLKRAVNSGVKNETIDALIIKVKYSYQLKWISYTDYRSISNGFYAVSETGIWTYINEDGSDANMGRFEIAGPVGESGIRVIYDGSKVLLIDAGEVVQGIINFVPDDAGIYSEGLIPIKKDDVYSYYNSLGDKQFGDYGYASTFVDGKAAIKKGNRWKLINSKGEEISENTYADIVLNNAGEYLSNGVMLAKKDNKYQLFDVSEKVVGSFTCDAIDIATEDGLIAFCSNGRWGFVDLEGNVVIEPTFSEAKSFSNGLAAVSNGDKWGFIDKTGTLVIDYCFFDADYFNKKGCCMVETSTDMWQMLSLYIVD